MQSNITNVLNQSNILEVAVNKIVPKWIVIDPNRFIQIFMNLLANANKFTKGGNLFVTVDWIPNKLSIPKHDLHKQKKLVQMQPKHLNLAHFLLHPGLLTESQEFLETEISEGSEGELKDGPDFEL